MAVHYVQSGVVKQQIFRCVLSVQFYIKAIMAVTTTIDTHYTYLKNQKQIQFSNILRRTQIHWCGAMTTTASNINRICNKANNNDDDDDNNNQEKNNKRTTNVAKVEAEASLLLFASTENRRKNPFTLLSDFFFYFIFTFLLAAFIVLHSIRVCNRRNLMSTEIKSKRDRKRIILSLLQSTTQSNCNQVYSYKQSA